MRIVYTGLCITLLALCGCGKVTRSTDAEEEKNPLVKRGQAYMDIKDYNKAEAAFKQAIENDPRMARPHLDLATIYHQYKPNYIDSITHYKRYLELRPGSEKTEFINEQIQKVQKALIQEILTQSGAYTLKKENEELRAENAALKRQLAARSNSASAPVQETATAESGTAPSAAAAQASHQIYTVVAGDTLSKIATEFYGSAEWEPIYEANKDRMKSPSDLRVGQTLIIPNR
jgi:LysM repeat protein